ncbi:MAG: fatty-acid--CoA ligase [Betaproteobacteria bacterium]|nr:fatty-acid--CoA ligase [Betaproteobacteria bacterium]
MLRALMMDQPLLISALFEHAARCHGDTEIVSRTIEGPAADGSGGMHRYTYAQSEVRAKKLAQALSRLGVREGERIGTFAWNGYRHFELYYGVSGMGAVIHTVNPRLFPEQLTYIVNHAEDAYVFFDLTFASLIEQLAPACKGVKAWVAMTDPGHMPGNSIPNLLCYEELLGAEDGRYDWPRLDENSASGLCYSSGTTGHPKGVLFAHRSTVLHAYGASLPDVFNCSARSVMLPVVPMFHVNAWGVPYMATLNGAKLVLPGAALDGRSLYELFDAEGVTTTAGVPTVWLGLLAYMRENKLKFSTLKTAIVGGSACPPAMIAEFRDDYGVACQHAWGMTEMSPLGTVCTLKGKHLALPREKQFEVQVKQGRPIYGVQMKIVDGEGRELPRDGKAFGDLMVRGPWVLGEYFKGEGGDPLREGWFPTGDVASIDPDGYMQITDRSKDVIKSGGEWISSIELENIAVAHPGITEAAVIGVPHPKWDERPLVVAVKKAGTAVTREELLAYYQGKVAKWWIPDDVVFVGDLPHTATGKLLKSELRKTFRDHRLPGT